MSLHHGDTEDTENDEPSLTQIKADYHRYGKDSG